MTQLARHLSKLFLSISFAVGVAFALGVVRTGGQRQGGDQRDTGRSEVHAVTGVLEADGIGGKNLKLGGIGCVDQARLPVRAEEIAKLPVPVGVTWK